MTDLKRRTRLVREVVTARPGPHMSADLRGGDPTLAFLALVYDEVQNARAKFPHPDASMVALVEEVGELAKALLDESQARVVAEAVQVACMALRVATEGDLSLAAYRIGRGLTS